MTDATVQAVIVAFFTALPPTLVAWGALSQGKKNGVKADDAIRSAETAATKADVAASKTDALHEETKAIKANTDGKLGELLAENKELREEVKTYQKLTAEMFAVMSAKTGMPITAPSQVLRRKDDPKGGNGDMHRRANDLKPDEPKDET